MHKSLYISNLGENVVENDMLTFFKRFGSLVECKIGQFYDGRCKGYARITYKNEIKLSEIKAEKPVFGGKEAKIIPFIEDEDLAFAYDQSITERRICVLKIPRQMVDAQLYTAFGTFGEIENAYIRVNRKKDTNHGFVTFKYKATAQDALKAKFVNHQISQENSDPLVIKEFQAKTAKKKQKLKEKAKKKNRIKEQTKTNNLFTQKVHNTDTPLPKKYRTNERNYSGFNQLFPNKNHNQKVIRHNHYDINDNRLHKKKYAQAYSNSRLSRQLPAVQKTILTTEYGVRKDISLDETNKHKLFNSNNNYCRREGKLYNYNSLVKRFSRRINRNHYKSNLLFSKAISGGEKTRVVGRKRC